MWIVGGYLHPEYSHIRQDVSTLISKGAPNKRLMDAFIITSSGLLLVFYLGLHWGINGGTGSLLGSALFICSGILGFLVALFFPLDEGGTMISTTAKLHFGLIALSGLFATAGMFMLWLQLSIDAVWNTFATFSLISGILSLVLVFATTAATKSNYLGLVERFMIYVYQVYYFILAFMIYLVN